MKINQKVVDGVFFIKLGHCGDYTKKSTLDLIRTTLKQSFGVEISRSEAHAFWCWRSEQYDASFLTTSNPKEIQEWFEKYCESAQDLEPDEEPYDPFLDDDK